MRLIAAVLACILLVAGCDSTESGSPTADPTGPLATAESTTDTPERFDPCRDIPDDALAATGVDPATEEKDIGNVAFDGWEVCTWTASQYFLNILVADIGLERAVAQNREFTGFEAVTIAGREALRFRTKFLSPGEDCDVAFQSAVGAVIFSVNAKVSADNVDDLCAVVDRHLVELERFVPE